jgi:hypothetical protein
MVNCVVRCISGYIDTNLLNEDLSAVGRYKAWVSGAERLMQELVPVLMTGQVSVVDRVTSKRLSDLA